MKCVYMIQSIRYPNQRYVGLASDVEARLGVHNAGRSPHTRKYMPWRLVVALRFGHRARAVAFERYLKSGSGRAFARRHLW